MKKPTGSLLVLIVPISAKRNRFQQLFHLFTSQRDRESMAAQDAAELKGPSPVVAFTVREREILQLRQQGMSHEEVATALWLEVQTVKNHMRNPSLNLQLVHWSTL